MAPPERLMAHLSAKPVHLSAKWENVPSHFDGTQMVSWETVHRFDGTLDGTMENLF